MPTPSPALTRAVRGARTVLFLCSGNVVRSAFAELYARHLDCPIAVSSAATVFRNVQIFPETIAALELCGVGRASIRSFRPRHLEDLLSGLDTRTLVLGMTRQHLELPRSRPGLAERTFLLANVLGESGDIADPVLEGADFARTFRRVAQCVEALVQALRPLE